MLLRFKPFNFWTKIFPEIRVVSFSGKSNIWIKIGITVYDNKQKWIAYNYR